MVSAIEIYNKPDFKYREESFVVLAVNAWELLLKAKILSNNKNKLKSIHIYNDKKKIKRTRSGNPMTIELMGAMRLLALDQTVSDNIEALIEIRDTAIHFFHTKEIKYLVFVLGTAMLRNFQKLVAAWFGLSLTKYHIFIMPMTFMHDFKTIGTLDTTKSSEIVANIIQNVASLRSKSEDATDYDFVCEIAAELISVKKSTGEAALTIRIDQQATNAQLAITQTRSKLDQYPFSYKQLQDKIKEAMPGIRPSQIDAVIKSHNIKQNLQFSAYSFRTKAQDLEYQNTKTVPKGTTSIYNESAIKYIINNININNIII